MARFKNFDWSLREGTPNLEGGGKSYPMETIQASLLLDIRDELQRLNGFMQNLGCIHSTLKGLRRDISKARRGHRRKV